MIFQKKSILGGGEIRNLIKAEFFKLRKSFAYKFMLGAYLLFEVWYNMNEVSNGILYTGVSYTGSEWFFQMPAGIFYIEFMWGFVAVFVAGDFKNRTYAAATLCGYPRQKVFLAKAVVFFVGMLPVMLIHAVVGTIVWTAYYGFGRAFGMDTVVFMIKPLIYYIICLSACGSTYILFAMLTKNRLGAMMMNFLCTWGTGCAMGNAIMLVKNPDIRRLIEFVGQFTINWQIGDLKRGEQAMIYPFGQVFIISVVRTIFMMLAAAYIFCRHDMK